MSTSRSHHTIVNVYKDKQHRNNIFEDEQEDRVILAVSEEHHDTEPKEGDNSNDGESGGITGLKALLRKRPNSAFASRREKGFSAEPQTYKSIERLEPAQNLTGPQRLTLHGSRLSRFYVPTSPNNEILISTHVHFIGLLPDEVLFEVLAYLEPKDLGRCMLVCRRWNAIADEERLWKKFALQYYPEDMHKVLSETYNINGYANGNSPPLGRRRSNPENKQLSSSFYRTTFLRLFVADQKMLKTGVWRNDRITRNARRNQHIQKEDYEYVHEQIRNNRSDFHRIKVVVVGDGAVGKTSLLCRFANNYFPEEDYLPTIFDNFSTQTIFNNTNYNVSLWDTAGPEDFDKLRPLSYMNSDVFLLCFELSYADSIRNSGQRWIQELGKCAPGVPIMLCGTKMDLRVDKKIRKSKQFNPVTFEMGKEIARTIGAVAYAETSALTGAGVAKAFEEVIRIGCMHAGIQKEGKKCGLM